VTIKIAVDDTAIIARLGAMPDKIHRALLKKVTALALKLEAKVKGKLSGDVLNVRSGALRRSVFNRVEDALSRVIGKVASSGDVKYAAIHEFGGKTPPHEILPVKAQALAFMAGGKQVFAKVVHHPGSQMPQRSFLRLSLTEMRAEIEGGLKEAVREGVNAR
jgi:phage gpG-like protein